MSTLWTPGGEREVPRDRPTTTSAPSAPASRLPDGGPGGPEDDLDREPTEEEIRAYVAAMQEQLAATPALAVVINHAMGLFELARGYLSLETPKIEDARLAIDSFAALVEGLAGRLGPDEPTLKDALAQIRMAFVQIRAASEGGGTPPPA